VLKKPSQERNIDVLETQIRWRAAQSCGGKLEHHPERIAVSRNRVWARAELGEQAIGKESLNQ
jgi:hypothetical protein